MQCILTPPPPSLFHLEKISNHFVSFHLFQVISVNIGQKLNVGQNAIYLNLILYLIFPFFSLFLHLTSLSLSLSLSYLSFSFFSFLLLSLILITISSPLSWPEQTLYALIILFPPSSPFPSSFIILIYFMC